MRQSTTMNRTLALLSGLVVVTAAGAVAAQDGDNEAREAGEAAMAAYGSDNHRDAERGLKAAIKSCGSAGSGRCSSSVVAKLHRDLGIVYSGGMGESAAAEASFRTALSLDPDIAIPDPWSSDEVQAAFERAKTPQAEAVERASDEEADESDEESKRPASPAAAAGSATLATGGAEASPSDTDGAASDHAKVVGHVGLGFLGFDSVPLADAFPQGTRSDPEVTAGDTFVREVSVPVVGVRFWFSQTVGLDLGLGLGATGGWTTTQGSDGAVTLNKDSIVGFGVLAGVPLAVANTGPLSLQITPGVAAGFAWSSRRPPATDDAPPSATLTGSRFRIGARGGAEVHFGFLGAPRLTLEGSVAAYATFSSATASVGYAEISDKTWQLTTTNLQNPWDFFTSSVAARYYF